MPSPCGVTKSTASLLAIVSGLDINPAPLALLSLHHPVLTVAFSKSFPHSVAKKLEPTPSTLEAYAQRQDDLLRGEISAAMQDAGDISGTVSAPGVKNPTNISDGEYEKILHDPRQIWIFGAYHKTGCELSVAIMANMRHHGNPNKTVYDVNLVGEALKYDKKQIFWPGKWDNFYYQPKAIIVQALPDFRFVHWVRDPVAIVLSAYRFHKSCPPGEPWLDQPMRHNTDINLLRDSIRHNRPDLVSRLEKAISMDRSLCQFYNEGYMPEESGVIIEAYRSMQALELMSTNVMQMAHDKRVLNVPMEAALADFTGTMKCMFGFLNLAAPVDIAAAVRKNADLDTAKASTAQELRGHVTRGKFDNTLIQEVVGRVPHVVETRQMMMKWIQESNACGAKHMYME